MNLGVGIKPSREQQDYETFLASKRLTVQATGKVAGEMNPALFPFQRDLVAWALKKGRCAIFADTGLGKTLMQLEWAKQAAERTLILAPLAVSRQTVAEGLRWGINVTYARNQAQSPEKGITITNYEMLAHFDPSAYGAVVLDESGILKSFEGKTRTALIEAFQNMPMRLCCTATPAPNDITEIANHAEFLGIMTRVEMLASFFIHDDKGWRLKGHARTPFYRWMASWAMSLRKPSDLGYPDDGYNLPALKVMSHIIPVDWKPEGMLFSVGLSGITQRSEVRHMTVEQRVAKAAELVNGSTDSWLVWHGLNDEGYALQKAIPGSVLVEGSQSPDEKADMLTRFAQGDIRVLVTKPSIAAWGLNFQRTARMVFVGINDSYEQYYQAIRRCYRFGQTREVEAHIVISEPESFIYDNVLRKEKEAHQLSSELIGNVRTIEMDEIKQTAKETDEYKTANAEGKSWKLMLGDSAERLKEVASDSVGLSVFSPPFATLFTYSNSERDLGNVRDYDEFWGHYSFITKELHRVMMPGRNVCVHVQQLPTTKAYDGVIGMRDFRGEMIAHMVAQGFIYHGEVCIDKDPQAQAIRTKSKSLLFVQLRKDSSWLRPAFADYILIFRKPGDNTVPVKPDLTNNEWIEWARPIWYGISESNTLNAAEARSNDDERHICPLQLGTIERCIRLWSNKGEVVLSPFAGIGSELHEAVRLGRRGVGVELKPEYFNVAVRNLQGIEQASTQMDLFTLAGVEVEAK